ncbi:MAG: hypothetical protein KIH62_000330 [Candidatus Kerfeldbacteria bacterium]|nr:hypothetical protein [Candidatus Kerfeldbacteria bacterium]
MDSLFLQSLKKTGLTSPEAQIYAALLERGGAAPSTIAEDTHLNRTTVYRTLEALNVKGLVSTVRKHKKLFYQAEGAEALNAFTRNRITVAERAQKTAAQLEPKIEGLLQFASHKPIIKFFEGKEGVRHIFEDHVAGTQSYEMFGFSNIKNVISFLGADFVRKYIAKKVKLNVITRGIFPDTVQDKEFLPTYYGRVPKRNRLEARYIEAQNFPFESELTIYANNKISIVNVHDDKLVGVIIEDQMMHDMLCMIFELAWKGSSIHS